MQHRPAHAGILGCDRRKVDVPCRQRQRIVQALAFGVTFFAGEQADPLRSTSTLHARIQARGSATGRGQGQAVVARTLALAMSRIIAKKLLPAPGPLLHYAPFQRQACPERCESG